MITIAIDVGINGAAAIMNRDELLEIHDLPVIDGVISGSLLAGLFAKYNRDVVVIEKIHATPVGTKANHSLGRNVGVILGVAGAMATPVALIAPTHWKKRMRFTTKGKDQKTEGREIAARLYPEFADSFKRVKDHDRADAVLIGRAYSMMRTAGDI